MSVVTANFRCPHCGYTIEKICEGIMMFGVAEFKIFKCRCCGHLQSEELRKKNEESYKPYVCNECGSEAMDVWDYKCPRCEASDLEYHALWADD